MRLWSLVLLTFLGASGFAQVVYTYDNSGHLTKSNYGSSGSIAYAYDAAGNLIGRTVQAGTASVITSVTTADGGSFIAQNTFVVVKGNNLVIYAVGFGLPSTPLTAGSSIQSGSLPNLPACTIASTNAAVAFAGLISPGLYQLNIQIPSNAPNGDSSITCAYGGTSTPAGDLITVQQ